MSRRSPLELAEDAATRIWGPGVAVEITQGSRDGGRVMLAIVWDRKGDRLVEVSSPSYLGRAALIFELRNHLSDLEKTS